MGVRLRMVLDQVVGVRSICGCEICDYGWVSPMLPLILVVVVDVVVFLLWIFFLLLVLCVCVCVCVCFKAALVDEGLCRWWLLVLLRQWWLCRC